MRLLVAIFLCLINTILSQENEKIAMVINIGYPFISGFEKQSLEKRQNLFFMEIGLDKYISEKVFYSISLSAYNLYYKTFYDPMFVGKPTGKYVMSRIGVGVNIWKEINLSESDILDIGFGFVNYFQIDTWLEKKREYYKRVTGYHDVLATQVGFRYLFRINEKNSLGILIEGNYLHGYGDFDFGTGLSYRHNFF